MATLSKDWWKSAIVYQIYPRSFCDSNGDGIGDLQGIISKLHYLKDLGVDVIWLSPVYSSPNCDNGYDISDYRNIHPDFGTLDDMDMLIQKAKRLGIKIIMDLVINHTSDEHEWFQKALAGEQEYKDFYYFQKAKKGKRPNNWGSFFGGDVWEKVGENEYYLHLFDKKQPDLNWHNPRVYNEVQEIMQFWIDRGIAGFRCDVINIIYKDSLADGRPRLALTGQEHYLTTSGCHDILHRFNHDIWAKNKCFIVGETVLVNTEMAKLLSDEEREELNTIFFFEHMDVDSRGIKWFKKKYKPKNLIACLDKWQNSLQWTANYLENHDQIRSVNHFGSPKKYWKESAKLLGGLNLCLRGTAFIYEGQEIGMTCGDFSNMGQLRDVESFTVDKAMRKLLFPRFIREKMILRTTRDHARTPVQWDESENAGFSTGVPWIQVNQNKSYINVKSEENDPDSILNFYKRLIEIRKDSEALSVGDYRRVATEDDVYVFTRAADKDRYYIYCNMTSEPRRIEMFGDKIVLDNYASEKINPNLLKPYEFRLVKTNF